MTTADVVVRPARQDDAAATAWLAALTFPLACPPGTPAATAAAHIAAHLTPAHFAGWVGSDEHGLVVAESQGSVVGYALIVCGLPDGEAERRALHDAAGAGPYVELSKIYVHPDRLGSGVAGSLIRAALAGAHHLAPDAPFWLGTNGENLRAQSFYRKHGFDVVGRRTYDVGGVLHDDVVMLHAAEPA